MLGSLISAGANLIGGLLGRDSARDQQAAQERMAQQNIALQREFAQQGIRWRVEDARAAGIHPAFAMGANTTSFSPVSIGSVADPLPNAVARAGSDIGRAVNATRTQPEREAAMSMTQLQLEGLRLDNDIKRASIASAVQRIQQQANPPLPAPTDLVLGGERMKANPAWSDASKVQDRWGEPAEWLYAPFVMGGDAYNNMPSYNDWRKRVMENDFILSGLRMGVPTTSVRSGSYRGPR